MRTNDWPGRWSRWGVLLLLALFGAGPLVPAAEKTAPRILVLGSKSPSMDPEGIALKLKALLAADKDLGQTDAAWQDAKVGSGLTLMNFYMFTGARIGHEVMLQLSTLSVEPKVP